MKNLQNKNNDPRRNLASVSRLLEESDVQDMIEEFSRTAVLEAIQEVLDRYRSHLKTGETSPGIGEIVTKAHEMLRGIEAESLRHVVNATGIILHTGLGRAVLPRRAVDALAGQSRCCNMQIDLETGKRGKRNCMTEYLLTKITGAEAAMVVNNNASAVLLALTALAKK
ncbi:L-seryl-tRNA(Sec) selenium transferase, partial [bacterium]|nr:L-seryl-tRNA(Sec) selenium transferase [bacterium]